MTRGQQPLGSTVRADARANTSRAVTSGHTLKNNIPVSQLACNLLEKRGRIGVKVANLLTSKLHVWWSTARRRPKKASHACCCLAQPQLACLRVHTSISLSGQLAGAQVSGQESWGLRERDGEGWRMAALPVRVAILSDIPRLLEMVTERVGCRVVSCTAFDAATLQTPDHPQV